MKRIVSAAVVVAALVTGCAPHESAPASAVAVRTQSAAVNHTVYRTRVVNHTVYRTRVVNHTVYRTRVVNHTVYRTRVMEQSADLGNLLAGLRYCDSLHTSPTASTDMLECYSMWRDWLSGAARPRK